MSQPKSISQMLTLRKLTRAVADHLTQQLRSHLATLAPLINPRNVFGVHLRSTTKQTVKGEAEAFEQLKGLYLPLAGSAPFNLRKDLESPLDIVNILPEIVPVDYAYEIQDAGQNKSIRITSPLKWVLTFSGSGPKRLRELLAEQKTIVGSDLQQCVLNYLVMHVTLLSRPGVTKLLEALRFPVTTGKMEDGIHINEDVEIFNGWEVTQPGTLGAREYDLAVADLVAFLQWAAEPVQKSRERLGLWVLLFLFVFTLIAWRLNAAYWKDIK